ncbi:glycosyltransferase family 2 protein [Maribacter sp. 2210JD10-5]|uniref:glycosyltransferase family 2 protein n=1 Tax=Maribacter sp. 2210JD10-5 TaxID=3386272 RepID=UPI0039BD2C8B
MLHKISVIVPVYNAQKYLARCLESIKNQTYENIEVLLINDGSTDSSGEICDKFYQNDERFQVFHKRNEGTSSARNKGLEYASGNYIIFIDCDDYIKPNMFIELINCALNEDLELVTCQYITTRDEVVGLKSIKTNQNKSAVEDFLEGMKYNPHGVFNVWNKLISSSLAKSDLFIHGKIHQDALYISNLLGRIDEIGVIKKPLYIYNVENESVTRSNYTLKRVEGIEVVLRAHSNLAKIARTEESKEAIRVWFTEFLFGHYSQLATNRQFDKTGKLKKTLISLIKLNHKKGTKDLRYVIAIFTPPSIFGLFHSLYLKFKNS